MKVVFLAAGYGTRLEKDLLADESGAYDHLKNIPKALLPIGPYSEPLASHWIRTLQSCPAITDVFLVTNKYYHSKFVSWAVEFPQVKLVCDGSTSNENRVGAVESLNAAIEQFPTHDDTLVIASDTLFYDDFSLNELIHRFQSYKSADPLSCMLLYVTCTDDEVHKYGILEADSQNNVTSFVEKPRPEETDSRKECPCFYFLSNTALSLIPKFIDERKGMPLQSRDATGHFIKYLIDNLPVYCTEISGRFDVGGLQSYIDCNGYFLEKHGMIDFS